MIRFEAEFFIRLHGIKTLVLQLIGLQLCRESNAASFLLFIQQNARALGSDHSECHLELLTAVAPQRAEDVTCQALRMNAYQRRLGMNVAHHQRNGALNIPPVSWCAFESQNAKGPPASRKVRLRFFLD